METFSTPWKTEKKAPGTVICSKRQKVLGRWNYEVAWKMAEGSRTNRLLGKDPDAGKD